MEEPMIRRIQREGAEALLNAGVSLPFAKVRMPWRKTPIEIRVTMRRPTLGRHIKIAREWLSCGTSMAEFRDMDYESQLEWIVKNGRAVSRIVALTMGWRRVPLWLSSWLVRHYVSCEYLAGAIDSYVSLMGTASFTNIISCLEMTNPMKRRLSQERKGS